MDYQAHYAEAAVDRDREHFLLDLLRELSGTLESAVGLEDAKGFISMVGRRIGAQINADYCAASNQTSLDRDHVAAALVDLKRRINGGFRIESIDDDCITLVNDTCPFGDHVKGRESLCMMTSNVFGRIAAENLGYSRVEISESIARGDSHCRVFVHLKPPATRDDVSGYEYFSN